MNKRLNSLLIAVFMILNAAPVAAQTFADLAVSNSSICGLLDTGEVNCSTRNTEVSPERYAPPSDLPLMSHISAGEQHSCGIDLSGNAICWGGGVVQSIKDQYPFGYFDQLNIPQIDQPLVSIASGTHHTCAIDVNSRAHCWGLNSNGQTEPPGDGLGSDGMGYTKIDADGNFSCGIQSAGGIECWSTDTQAARGNIEGPFLDLDVSRKHACGLKEDGSILCWQGAANTPVNGPYTDLVVSESGVCGLTLNQILDCKGESFFTDSLPILPTDFSYVEIESSTTAYYTALPFCGLTVAGGIVCSKEFAGFEIPGTMSNSDNDLSDVRLPLTAVRYSKNLIELAWAEQPQRYGQDALRYEIYRNDQLVDTTSNLRSWFDGSQQTVNPVSYKIRATDGRGRLGPFSTTLFVDNETGSVTQDNNGTINFPIVTPSHTVDNVEQTFVGNTAYITWNGSTPGTDGLKGYEVRVDNEVVSYSDGFSTVFDGYSYQRCFLVSVAAMSFDDKIINYRTIVVNRRANNYSCGSF